MNKETKIKKILQSLEEGISSNTNRISVIKSKQALSDVRLHLDKIEIEDQVTLDLISEVLDSLNNVARPLNKLLEKFSNQ